jgi:hypothetical protein
VNGRDPDVCLATISRAKSRTCCRHRPHLQRALVDLAQFDPPRQIRQQLVQAAVRHTGDFCGGIVAPPGGGGSCCFLLIVVVVVVLRGRCRRRGERPGSRLVVISRLSTPGLLLLIRCGVVVPTAGWHGAQKQRQRVCASGRNGAVCAAEMDRPAEGSRKQSWCAV